MERFEFIAPSRFSKGDGPTLGPPKSDAAYRVVALPATITDLLRAHVAEYTDASPSALVFTSVQGIPLLNRYFAPIWVRAKRAAGVDDSVRFHDLRHFAGNVAASSGASLREIMSRMGHSSSDASLRYLKAGEDRDREVANAIEHRISATGQRY